MANIFNKIVQYFQKKKEEKAAREREYLQIQAQKEQERLLTQSILADFFTADLPALVNKASELDSQKLIDTVEKSIDNALDDNYLSCEEEKRISDFMDHFAIQTSHISESSLTKITQGAILRDLFESKVNPRLTVSGLPFNLMKKEILIWAAPVSVSEIKTVKGWVGGSSGVSFRVMKGVYWRVGKTKGRMIESQEYKNLGSGVAAITNYNVYLKTNQMDCMRIKLEKIISVEADSQNMVIYRDGARSNPICLRTPDAWFLANVTLNATNWQ